jgi:hypothetical protein
MLSLSLTISNLIYDSLYNDITLIHTLFQTLSTNLTLELL